MSHPFELPGAGVKKFHSNEVSKESLLEYWRAIRVKFGIKIQENEKFESLAAEGQAFRVKTSAREVTAKKVILALGVRGSPRRLNVPGESLEKVTYNLLDPEQYQSRRVVVVGGGNAGVEAAQALAQGKWKNKVHLLVRGPSFDRCNAENQRRIRELESAGRVTIWMNAEIKEISRDAVQVKKGDQAIGLPNDFVFIYAGAEMPHKFLMSLGIVIDKKFGEGLEAG
jgi:thioredoxin reductase